MQSVRIRKVIHITRASKGGVPVVVDQIARGLNRNRYEPIVLFETNEQSDIRKKLHESNIQTIDLKRCLENKINNFQQTRKSLNFYELIDKKYGNKFSQIYLSIIRLKKFLLKQTPRILLFLRVFKENKVDLVHTHSNLYLGKPEIIAAWILGVPCVSHNHGYFKLTQFDSLFSHFVSKFIYISKDVAQYYTSMKYPQLEKKGTIIHNGIDISKFTNIYETDYLREEFGIEPDQPLVGIIGRIDWWKGHEYFLESIVKANQKIPNLKGLIIGDLEKKVAIRNNKIYYQKLKTLIKKFNLSDKIIFTGYRSDIPKIMASLDVVVHASSIPEPFGIVIIEGMAAGKPVIATKAGGALDIIDHGVNGLLVPCKDSEAMGEAMVSIMTNSDMGKKLGINAQRRVLDKFTVQRQVNALQELYDSIFENSSKVT